MLKNWKIKTIFIKNSPYVFTALKIGFRSKVPSDEKPSNLSQSDGSNIKVN